MWKRLDFSKVKIMGIIACLPTMVCGQGQESKPASGERVLAPLVVTGETANDRITQGPFLPNVMGTSIYAGKKTAVMDFDSLPQIQTDNYRQAFAKTPGLLTSEVSNSSLLSLNYRGIGDPHESQNIMVLKNGIPFVLDPLGYSTVYFAPPFESLDRLEFVSGGGCFAFRGAAFGSAELHQPRARPHIALPSVHAAHHGK